MTLRITLDIYRTTFALGGLLLYFTVLDMEFSEIKY
jgi:hypothetical protein